MAENVVDELKERELKIRSLQESKSRLEGRKEQLLKDFKSKFGCSTLEEGQKLLEEKREKLESINSQVVTLMVEMDEIIDKAQKNAD